jgi:hypothetical protein
MSETKKKSRWGVGIFAFYSAFVVATVAMVLFVSLQKIQLVEPDYYQKELVFQQQIERIKRTQALPSAVSFDYNRLAGLITVAYPPEVERSRLGGEIVLMRPSNADLDRRVPVLPDSTGRQAIDVSGLLKGLWRLKAVWTIDSDEYYSEDMVVIQ